MACNSAVPKHEHPLGFSPWQPHTLSLSETLAAQRQAP